MAETPRVSAELRTLVVERARHRCEYCLSPARYATQRLSVEHVLPRAKGGQTTLANLALACQGCNNHKYNHTEATDPVSELIVPLYHPRHDRWCDHFAWSADLLVMVGITPTGRATVAALLLNRDGIVNLRRLLLGVGEHPPTVPEL
ncbi:HNH endonuclease [Candidatus Viridilinea mediisalina]|uniref:HNH endonuclease n=1 Tax=Candidatus Viridilinea mediisalina TaxID=2024553 RepID=A0A2A6RKA0_9CHLR|nr:HNH endonuclease [Candidatus Viridilinea mediisalina]PDW03335.1 HNH endonuclease [Candidatus Viridilinea mediisalina]